MACYASSNYTILIDSSANLKVKDRTSGRVVSTFALSTCPVKITKSSASFCPVGTTVPGDGYLTTTPVSGNVVNITTSTVLMINVSESIDLATYDAVIVLDGTNLKFYTITV